jgi:effector-binding domain-containing protein
MEHPHCSVVIVEPVILALAEEVLPRAQIPSRILALFDLKCVALAAGRPAHAVHVGPYGEMDRTYIRLHAWSRAENLRLTGESWEVYGDWTEDASKLETGLFLRIDAARSEAAAAE